ncbi:Ribonuclease H domain - like 6 [Theobroma cacao]|nr:Ribonuclease H domain - like 6 [Theobroma cacao]
MGDANLTEVRAIKEDFLIFSASQWASTHVLIVESDSKIVVKCVNNPNEAPWKMRKWILHIESLKKSVPRWEANHILREKNQVADHLAKEGVQRPVDLINIFD